MHKIKVFVFNIYTLISFFSVAVFADSGVVNAANSPVFITPANKSMLSTLGIKNSAQNISFSDNEQISVILSNTDINRLAIQGDKIQNINAPLGLYTAKNDISGAVYVTLNGTLPFTMYLTTVGGHTVSLFINPRPIVGKVIILQPTSTLTTATHWEKDSNYQKILVTVIANMINHQTPDGYVFSAVSNPKTTDFYGIANLRPVAIYTGSNLTGLVFEVKNKTRGFITLRPAYFYKTGVRAVALSVQTIDPYGIAFLYEVINKVQEG